MDNEKKLRILTLLIVALLSGMVYADYRFAVGAAYGQLAGYYEGITATTQCQREQPDADADELWLCVKDKFEFLPEVQEELLDE